MVQVLPVDKYAQENLTFVRFSCPTISNQRGFPPIACGPKFSITTFTPALIAGSRTAIQNVVVHSIWFPSAREPATERTTVEMNR